MATPTSTPLSAASSIGGGSGAAATANFAASFNNALAQALGADVFGGGVAVAGSDRLVNETCLELLNAELVDAWTAAPTATAAATSATSAAAAPSAAAPTAAANAGAATNAKETMVPSEREVAFAKIEAVGFSVGQRLAERHSSESVRMVENMDYVKFICRDLWLLLFKKQADRLQTNHKGTFVVHDAAFRWFVRISGATPGPETNARARLYAALTCGIIRGALHNLGLPATVSVDVPALPQCSFKITASKGA